MSNEPGDINHKKSDDCGCDEVYQHLFEYLDSEMTERDQVRIRQHISHCQPCLSEISFEELIRQILRRACLERAPEDLRAKITQRLRSADLSFVSETSVQIEFDR